MASATAAAGEAAEGDVLLRVLRDPRTLQGLNLQQAEQLLRQARAARLLGRIATMAHAAAVPVPAPLVAHFDGVRRLLRAHRDEVRREVGLIGRVLAPLGLPLVLLKGAAYGAGDLPAGCGRLFADIDILVPQARLVEAEAALLSAGWMSGQLNAYDQRYYRQWMHEIPPLQHVRRLTVLDVHHALTPQTSRRYVPGAQLRCVPLAGFEGLDVQVLAPADMVLHSLIHLLWNEDYQHGLRDLSDLDLLFRAWAGSAGFVDELAARARALGLQRVLHQGLVLLQAVLLTPVPAALLASTRAAAAYAPLEAPLQALLQACWRQAVSSLPPGEASPWRPLALAVLLVRAHVLRMPSRLLLRHVAVKLYGLVFAFRRAA